MLLRTTFIHINFPSGNLTVTWVLLIPDLFEKAVFLFKSFILLALGLNFCDSFPASLEVKYFKIRKLMWTGVWQSVLWETENNTTYVICYKQAWKLICCIVENFVKYSQTSIIRISWLSGLFLRSQFGHEYLFVTIKIRSHILFKTTALFKGAVKCEGFCSQRAKAALALVVSNEEYSNEFWLDQSCVVAKWNSTLYGMENKEASVTNVYSRSWCL